MVSSLISSVRGRLEAAGADWADIAVGGITLRVSVPSSSVESLGNPGDNVRLFTSMQVREDSMSLYGFETVDARETFEVLIGINGIGPRVALSILSLFTPETLAAAVDAGDLKAFTPVPGVGRRTASRIVLELKGKLEFEPSDASAAAPTADAIDALTALGYSAAEAREALAAIPRADANSTEDRVRLALAQLAGA